MALKLQRGHLRWVGEITQPVEAKMVSEKKKLPTNVAKKISHILTNY